MAIVKTLEEVSRAVSYGAAIKTGAGSTFRHPTADVIAEINSAFVEQQEQSIVGGFSFYGVEGSLTNLPTSRVTSDNYSLVDWPEEAHQIVRVDVLVAGEWDKLIHVDWENMRDVLPRGSSAQSQRPTHYSARQFAGVSAATVSDGKIAILPFSSSGQYKLTTIPRWEPITDTSHKFIFPSESAFRWTVHNVKARIAERDPKGGQRYEKSVKGMAIAEQRMGKSSPVKLGGTMRRSVRGRWG